MEKEPKVKLVDYGRMGELAVSCSTALNVEVKVLALSVFVPQTHFYAIKQYRVSFKRTTENTTIEFEYKAPHANDVKRFLAALLDLKNMGIIIGALT